MWITIFILQCEKQ